jgi:quercetin 2,3-dioxygenase
MSHQVHSPAPVRELPGEPVPYYLADGDGRAHLLLGQVGRALAGTEETAGAMSVMTAVGPAGGPIPMHRHEKEHDYFFCVRGAVQVWADGKSRIL